MSRRRPRSSAQVSSGVGSWSEDSRDVEEGPLGSRRSGVESLQLHHDRWSGHWSDTTNHEAISCRVRRTAGLTRVPSVWLMTHLARVQGWLEEQVPPLLEKYGVPAAAWAVLAGDEVVDGAAGILHRGTGVEATPDSVFQIGSITKLWTASLVMKLADEGRVDLEAPGRPRPAVRPDAAAAGAGRLTRPSRGVEPLASHVRVVLVDLDVLQAGVRGGLRAGDVLRVATGRPLILRAAFTMATSSKRNAMSFMNKGRN